MHRVLIVSPNFPPNALAGVHRARILAKYLPQHGWEAVVFTVAPLHYEQDLDPDLADTVPDWVPIIRCQAWSKTLSRRFGLGDIGIRAYRGLRKQIAQYLKHNSADLLLISVFPGFPMLLGPYFKQRMGLPFVIDYQDPYIEPGTAPALWSKPSLARAIAEWVEPRVFPHANGITAVSAGTNELLQQRYPNYPLERYSDIPIGVDVDDLANADKLSAQLDWMPDSEQVGIIKICYVGCVWPPAIPVLKVFLRACAALCQDDPKITQALRLIFVGTSNQAQSDVEGPVSKIAAEIGLSKQLIESARRVPYLDALKTTMQADINFLLGSLHPHYTASKLYPILLAQRPAIGIFHQQSSVCEVVQKIGGLRLLTFSDEQDLDTLVIPTQRALTHLIHEPQSLAPVPHEQLAEVDGNGVAGRFAESLERALTCCA